MALQISIDSSEYTKMLKRLDRKLFPDAVRGTLNDIAKKAAISQRGQIKKVFTVRNKYVVGSIRPHGNRPYGLIPTSNSNIHGMNAFSGTHLQYMADQEKGFTKTDPSIPTYKKGRMGGTFKGRVKGPVKMRKIKRSEVKRVKDLGLRGRQGSTRTKQAVAMLARQGFRGYLKLGKQDGWNEGYYRMTKTKIDLVRSTKHSKLRFRKREWHRPAIDRVAKKSVVDVLWARQARKLIAKL